MSDKGMPRPTIGRIVHYVLGNGEHRCADVVRDWENDTPNLLIKLDGHNDATAVSDPDARAKFGYATTNDGMHVWATSVAHDETTKAPGTWHWPERG
jgi:hypothetical protein